MNLTNFSYFMLSKMEEGLFENAALVKYYNEHYKERYLICESRENGSTRLFIRNVTNMLSDAVNEEGWYNTFTVTKNPTSKGLWLSKVIEYRLDRNGYINLEVETITPIDDIKFHTFFNPYEGTWNSIAWWVMIVQPNAFLPEYQFYNTHIYHPNYDALIKRFPEFKELNQADIGKRLLIKYLRNEVDLEDIEHCLSQPSEWELLVSSIQQAIAKNNVEKLYGDKYPLFAKKINNNVSKYDHLYVRYELIESYLIRQLDYYYCLLNDGKIEAPTENDILEAVEKSLCYRKALKDAEKAAKKKNRKK